MHRRYWDWLMRGMRRISRSHWPISSDDLVIVLPRKGILTTGQRILKRSKCRGMMDGVY